MCWCAAEDDARRLLDLLSDVYCMVNLIVFNPHEGTRFQRSDDDQVRKRIDCYAASTIQQSLS
jgi:adenine C2-methylase RlmN of 23S rRNA A2503 and tRNA A37